MPTPVQTLVERRGGEGGSLRLLVFSDVAMGTHPLPDSGVVVIGRSEEADIQIDVPSLSRRHAALHLGPTISIEDLGSVNGTRVRGKKLSKGELSEVAPGEAIELGSTTVVVQRYSPSETQRPRRIWTHGYFEARLEEECARNVAGATPFALVRVRLESGNASAVEETLAAKLRHTDIIALYGPREYEVLLLDMPPPRAEVLVKQLQGELDARGVTAEIGLACHGRDGRDPEQLISRARPGDEPKSTRPRESIVVASPKIQKLHELAQRVARSDISVLLLGETGVGKEIFAEQIHKHSARASKPFLRLNCAALSESLIESELFGHEKGAFTGAVRQKLGLLESANGGTVFLDEIGELPTSMQVKLLRVLERREVMRVGDLTPRPVDVRFVAATNRDLELESERGNFRQDLYFRLNGISLVIPPLRERVEEIAPMAKAFIARAADAAHVAPPELSPEALALLEAYHWPGNIRELRNVIDRAVLLCGEDVIRPEHLPVEKLTARVIGVPARPPAGPTAPPAELGAEAAEKQRILDALAACGGNQTLAAKQLGMARRTLISRLEKYGIARPRKIPQP